MKEEQAPYIAASSYIYNTLHAFHNPEHNFVRDSFLTDLILTGQDGGQDCSTMPTNNLRIVDFAQRLESTNQNKNDHKAYVIHCLSLVYSVMLVTKSSILSMKCRMLVLIWRTHCRK